MGFISAPVDLSSPAAIGSTTPNTGAFTTLSANNGTLTANSPAATFTQTWNNAAVTFTGFRASITDTASAAASLLMDLQVGGSSKLSVDKDGKITIPLGAAGTFTNLISGGTSGSAGLIIRTSNGNSAWGNFSVLRADNTAIAFSDNTKFGIAGSLGIGASTLSSNFDCILARDAANILAQRNSTSAQTFRIYNTYTDASNYERGFFRWNTNVLEIGAEAAGTGTQRQLRFPLGTVTASTPLSVTQTWNSAGVTFTGIQANITDTASASGSLLMDLQVGAVSQFNIRKDGRIAIFSNGSSGDPAIRFISSASSGGAGIHYESDNIIFNHYFNRQIALDSGANVRVHLNGSFGFTSSSSPIAGTYDTILKRDSAGTLAQRNSTNAQTFRLYRTYTDASNYERLGFLSTNTTRYTITSENAGSGSARSLEVSFYTSASDPTSTDITSGCFSVWKNSGTGTIKLWANDGGTMKSVALA